MPTDEVKCSDGVFQGAVTSRPTTGLYSFSKMFFSSVDKTFMYVLDQSSAVALTGLEENVGMVDQRDGET